jgi:hypothetical protein
MLTCDKFSFEITLKRKVKNHILSSKRQNSLISEVHDQEFNQKSVTCKIFSFLLFFVKIQNWNQLKIEQIYQLMLSQNSSSESDQNGTSFIT